METQTVQQSVSASGSGMAINLGHVGLLSGGVQISQVTNYRVVGESRFYELDLHEPAAGSLLDPPRAEELTALLAESRLLILAGELEDKGDCARRIALRLGQRLRAEGRAVSIRERYRGKDPQRIETAFHEEGTTILVLPEISLSLIAGYPPAKLRRLLLDRDAYAIVTTDCSRGQWDIADGTPEARLWQELSWETYYGRERMAGYLEQLVFGSDLAIPEGLVSEGPDGEPTVGGVPLVRVVESLKVPERILRFVTAMVEEEAPPTPEGVEAKLVELAGDAAAIHQWYLQFDDRDQLLVVGLVLLDGLPDDLLFAGLEILVETVWRETDPLFSQFDYRDLSRFAAYFKQTPVDGGFVRIECGSRRRRADILQVAWDHQRRRLLATLPALIEMIRASASAPAAQGGEVAVAEPGVMSAARLAAERALSRTQSGSMQLHQVVVESLSLIGLLSVEVVEPYLLDLAADPSETVQLLAASALAVWREADRGGEFFALLHRWWAAACDVGDADSEIARAASLSPDPWAAVRAAVALTVGHAAQYDRENHLAPELMTLLEVLIDDPHPRVRIAVWKHMLPRTVAWHFARLEPFLRQRLLASADFVEAVARGAAEACEMRPGECLPIVERWWAEARADTRHGSRLRLAPREILLATVAETFGFIRASDEHSALSREALVEKLRAILTEEGHPFVRRHALQGVETQTLPDLELAARLLPDLLVRLTLEDRPQVVALAVRSYLYQRQRLAGGDRKLEIDGRSYAVWTEAPRPLTGIELTLYGWLVDDSRPVAQQVAVDAFAAIAATALDREERRLLATRSPAAALHGGRGFAAEPEVYTLNPFGRLAVVLATPGKEELRPLLRPLMAEVIVRRKGYLALLAELRRRARRLTKGQATALQSAGSVPAEEAVVAGRIEVLLERWGGVRNDYARALTGYLRRAVVFYRWRWGVVAVMGLLCFELSRLYGWADVRVREPLAQLAEQVVPSPSAPQEFMAPLLPGRLSEGPVRFPYIVKGVAYSEGWPRKSFPEIYLTGTEELAAPLGPGWTADPDAARGRRTAAAQEGHDTPKERAWAWKNGWLWIR